MQLAALAPILWTDNLDQSITFYCHKLHFHCAAHSKIWASLERDGLELMLSLPNRHEPFSGPSFTGSLYFRCDDVDIWWKSLKDNAPIVYPIQDFEYGMREFAIRDNNGYTLQFGKALSDEELAPAGFGPSPTIDSVLDLAGSALFHMTQPMVSIMGHAQLAEEQMGPANPVAKHIVEIRKSADLAEAVLKELSHQIRHLQERKTAVALRHKPAQ